MTPLERDRAEVALQHLRERAKSTALFSEALTEASRQAGITLTREQQEQVLREVRNEYGDCVVVPRIRRFSLTSQANSISER
jgi:hypothetical protein